jgi:O-antigen ligase
MRLLVLGPLAVVLTLVVVVAAINVMDANTEYLGERLTLVTVTGNSEEDLSYTDRVEQTRVAFDAFKAHPLLGTGGAFSKSRPRSSSVSFTLEAKTSTVITTET